MNIQWKDIQAREEGCYGQPRAFADAHTRVSYFRGADVHPDYALFQEPGARVTVMCGLPASGKDTWVAAHRLDQPVVSFDDARAALGLKHGHNEGKVAHAAVDKAKSLLRERASFVWNATHLSQQMRDKTLDLLFAYGAQVEIVYLERPRAELLRRNGRRDTSLSNSALQGMLRKGNCRCRRRRTRCVIAPPTEASPSPGDRRHRPGPHAVPRLPRLPRPSPLRMPSIVQATQRLDLPQAPCGCARPAPP